MEPCVSIESAHALVIGVLFAVVGCGIAAVGAKLTLRAARRLGLAKLGEGLLAVCGGERVYADNLIAELRGENEDAEQLMRRAAPAAFRFPLWDDLA